MAPETIRIDELRLRVPGLSEWEARRLAEEVARRVAARLPAEGRQERVALWDLRIAIPSDVGKESLAERIAEGILKALR